ncbi:MAG: tetratricopeptide repeat protein [Candidatus Obscuribacterales bacterium]|nr:tetratricopeptide repeat protein [Candidatus Obscuribacterales bacterium]
MYIYRQRHSVATTLLALAISMSGCSLMPNFDNSMKDGRNALSEGQLNRAEQHFQQAIAEAEKSGKHTHQVAVGKVGLADTYVEQEIYDDAETLYEDALEIEGTDNNETTVKIYHGLGKLNCKRQTFALSEKYLQKALKMQLELDSPDEIETANIYTDLADLNLLKGKPTIAKENFEKSLEILEGLEKKQYKLQEKVTAALANIAADDQDMDAAQDYKKRLTDLQLDHAKNVMSVLPWVTNKQAQPADTNNSNVANESPSTDTNTDSVKDSDSSDKQNEPANKSED